VSVRYTNFNNWIVKNLVAVQVNKIQPGDSGSPVYNNSITAVGIGVAYANSGDEWYYTSVQAALQTMSGSLLTFQPGTAP
jgi:V8-like Glu-specific endopeptidase